MTALAFWSRVSGFSNDSPSASRTAAARRCAALGLPQDGAVGHVLQGVARTVQERHAAQAEQGLRGFAEPSPAGLGRLLVEGWDAKSPLFRTPEAPPTPRDCRRRRTSACSPLGLVARRASCTSCPTRDGSRPSTLTASSSSPRTEKAGSDADGYWTVTRIGESRRRNGRAGGPARRCGSAAPWWVAKTTVSDVSSLPRDLSTRTEPLLRFQVRLPRHACTGGGVSRAVHGQVSRSSERSGRPPSPPGRWSMNDVGSRRAMHGRRRRATPCPW